MPQGLGFRISKIDGFVQYPNYDSARRMWNNTAAQTALQETCIAAQQSSVKQSSWLCRNPTWFHHKNVDFLLKKWK